MNGGKYCQFEREGSSPDQRKQKCIHQDRVKFLDDYNSNECKIVLSNIQLSDAGDWTCKMYGGGKGNSRTKTLQLDVIFSPERRPGII